MPEQEEKPSLCSVCRSPAAAEWQPYCEAHEEMFGHEWCSCDENDVTFLCRGWAIMPSNDATGQAAMALCKRHGGIGYTPRTKETLLKFLLVIKQKGQGCDYAVGCGINLSEFSADSREDAVAIAYKALTGCGMLPEKGSRPDTERVLDKAWLLEMNEASVVAFDWQAELGRRVAIYEFARQQQKEEAERAEFERLAAKFGKKP